MSLLSSACRNAAASRPATRSRPRALRLNQPARSAIMRYSSVTAGMRRLSRHLILAGFTLTAAARLSAGQTRAPYTATFDVFVGNVRLGGETMTITETADGRKISSIGRLNAPVDMTTNKFEVTYTADWQPQQLQIEGVLK